jgi:hydroxypyruvate reductase/glycerate 2-kinase
LALLCALSLEGQHDVTMISLGTDGIDGPTDVASAIIDSFTTLKARKNKLNPEEFIINNDSYHFHEHMETLIKTGATGNNLMDLQVLFVE